ncbi:MAG: DUF2269 family protein [Actinomycetota bacterium]|nr:DUF2269 family protein [Actinomycetota bacterium]
MVKLILLVHVLAGATWFGAHVYIEGLMASASRTRDSETIMRVGLRVAQTNRRVLVGAGAITIIFGAWIVFVSVYTFEMLFVAVGLAVSILGLALSLFIFNPKVDEIEAIVAERGLTDPEALAKMKSLGHVRHATTLLLTTAMVLMVLQPGA